VEVEMKNIVRLILVISICFTVVFLISSLVSLLQIRIGSIRAAAVLSKAQAWEFVAAVQGALPVTIYFSTLLGISYTARKSIPIPVSIICLVILGMGYALLIVLGTNVIAQIPFGSAPEPGVALGKPGFIFAQPDRSLVFLQEPGNSQSPRVVAIPDAPLIYQQRPIEQTRTESTQQGLGGGFYSALLRSDMAFFLNSMLVDFDFTTDQFQNRFKEGFIFFVIYLFGLIFLLSSLRFIMDMSTWPLANLFLGILAFRGILALERFLDSGKTQQFFTSFIGDRFPDWLISPLAFCTLGIIIILYTALIHLGKSRRTTIDEDY
jgi:hypothetical protein